jgi:hypothetical protein
VSRLLDHLQRQLESSRRLLEIVLTQSAAIRRRDVAAVLASLSDVQTELAFRDRLESERSALIQAAAAERNLPPESVNLEMMLIGVPGAEAAEARARSAELVGLVSEIARIHEQNRLLLRQELTFLDYLMRILSGAPQGGYSASGWTPPPQRLKTVDARA